MTNYAEHIRARETPQSQAASVDQVQNSASGYTFQITPWQRLRRFLILGCDKGTYYASEKELTLKNFDVATKLLEEDGQRFVREVIDVSVSGVAPKNDAAIFCLAIAAGIGNQKTRAYALDAVPVVCRTSTHLFQFVDAITHFRGWGRGLRNGVARWYRQPLDKLAYQLTKYRSRKVGKVTWTHADLLRLSHVKKLDGSERDALFRWVLGAPMSERVVGERKYAAIDAQLPDIVQGFELAQRAETTKDIIKAIDDFGLTHDMVPNEWKGKPEVWDALLDNMPVMAMIRNIGRMTASGCLRPLSERSRFVASRLHDVERLRKARIHPFNLLLAMKTYGHGRGFKGSLSWEPIAQILEALDSAFTASFGLIEPTGKRTIVAIDVSGSMDWSIAGSPLVAREAACAMALVPVRTEDAVLSLAFSHELTVLPFSKGTTLTDAVDHTNRMIFGRTDCALPMTWALDRKITADVFHIYTDNETWFGQIHPHQALQRYRERMGIDAKLVVQAFTATEFTIADPSDSGMLDVVGLDSSAPSVVQNFVAGSF